MAVLALLTANGIAAAQCVAPPTPVIDSGFSRDVSVDQTYAISWTATAGEDGWYIVERSQSPQFDSKVDVQYSGANASSFLPAAEGLYYHRVRAVAACSPEALSSPSLARSIRVIPGKPLVVLTVQPEAVFADTGESLEQKRTALSLENRSRSEVVVNLAREEIACPPFFRVTDSAGNEVTTVVLQPQVPHTLEIRFGGPSTASRGAYQGLVIIRGVNEELSSTAYAYVTLTVGGTTSLATPVVRFQGSQTDSVFFPGFPPTIPDAGRAPLQLELMNPGDLPMEVGAEVGPELWLTLRPGWNASPIPPRGSIQVDLLSTRERATQNAAFPRYTYVTFRNRNGSSARVLVQDSDRLAATPFSIPPLPAGTRSFLIPMVARLEGSQGVFKTRIRITNVSRLPVTTEIFYVPIQTSQSSAFRTSVTIPPNDVVSSSDVLLDLFGFDPNGVHVGQLEIRTAEQNAQFLTVNAVTYAQYPIGEAAFEVPVILAGEGARAGSPHFVSGLFQTTGVRTNLILIETSRTQLGNTRAMLLLRDQNGEERGRFVATMRPGEYHQISLLSFPGSAGIAGGHVEVSIEEGGGTITVAAALLDNVTGQPLSTHVSRPLLTGPRPKSNLQDVSVRKTYVVVGAQNGPSSNGNVNYQTTVGITAPEVAADVTVSLLNAGSKATVGTRLTIPAGQTIEYPNILASLFAIAPGSPFRGMISITTSSPVQIYGRLVSAGPIPQILGKLPILGENSDATTGTLTGFTRPVYFDGLEQSIDLSRGSRWSLELTELNARPLAVMVRLYEAGNREAPIAERRVTVAARDHMILETIFAAVGLDEPDRRKDRTNVQVMIVPESGSGLIAAVAAGVDVRTGTTTRYVLTPNGGVAATGVSKVAVHVVEGERRRRPVRH